MARVLAVRVRVKKRAKGRCELCGVQFVDKPHRPKSGSMHHLFPRRDGGSDAVSNLIYICLACHSGIHYNEPYAYEVGWLRKVDSPDAPVMLKGAKWVVLAA